MRVAIDCSSVAKAARTGVARYCSALLGALPDALSTEDSLRLLYRISRWKRRHHRLHLGDPRCSSGWFSEAALRLTVGRPDVFHGPDLRLPPLRGVPLVSTVHDLSALDLPEVANDGFREKKRRALADVARRATAILCVSSATERAVHAHHPETEGRTRVVPLGLDPMFRVPDEEAVAALRNALGLRGPYVVFIGQLSTRKNLLPLVEAFDRLAASPEHAALELVLAGPVQSGGELVTARVEASPFRDRIHLPGYVQDDQLVPLYAGAAASCFLGKGEGFGLPILESMACGTPVVVADAGASPETGGEAAIVIDPDDVDRLTVELARLHTDPDRRAECSRRGLSHAAGYSWAETARLTVDVYREAIRTGARA